MTIVLLAMSRNSRLQKSNRKNGLDRERVSSGSNNNKGRNRYNRSGKKKTASSNESAGQDLRQKKTGDSKLDFIQPSLTELNEPRPTYFTCRHTYEDTLMDEIQRQVSRRTPGDCKVVLTSPSPGIVHVKDPSNALPKDLDPVYALQAIPDAVVVSSESIKGLAKVIYTGLLGENGDDKMIVNSRCQELQSQLRLAPRGSLAVHGLVPGMCKGQNNPVMLNRSQRVTDELSKMFRKGFAAARKSVEDQQNPHLIESSSEERWVLQVLLTAPNIAVASLTKCINIRPGKSFWPNWHLPVGMAKVDIEEKMPSSAYRKLMEALQCMQIRPEPFQSYAVDLGASPGGWTSVLRRLDCHVVSVDRSKLDPKLMKDEMVQFVKGDAFTFAPEENEEKKGDVWMVSDVIAYPERVNELLTRWCSNHWARYMIITMKFQGEKPAFDDLDHALNLVEQYGYQCRAKHFFNNKNEVTLMIHENQKSGYNPPLQLDKDCLGSSMYKAIYP
jgi:23S rRNA C2498 (ribose-2'-O)-methylase RlmM